MPIIKIDMQIIYFPYLHLQDIDELSFGDIKVWNFKKKASSYIPDETLRNHVQSLLNTNIIGKRIIDDMGILSIGNTDFREFNEDELETANELRLIMFLAYLAKNNVKAQGANSGWQMATAENFSFVTQNFQLGSDHIAEGAGFIVHMGIGGYKVHEVQFKAPSHVLSPMRFSLDGLLIKNLLQMKQKQKKLYKRILRATDLLFESYFNDPNVSKNARILLQVGAFEVLLDLPEEGQRKALKEEIAKLVDNGDKHKSYFFEMWSRKDQKMIKKRDKGSLKVIWADRFYTLRNHLIHGNDVKIDEFYFENQRHMDIAIMFFVLIVKKLINEKGKKKIFFDEISWKQFKNDRGRKIDGFLYEDNDLLMRLTLTTRRWKK